MLKFRMLIVLVCVLESCGQRNDRIGDNEAIAFIEANKTKQIELFNGLEISIRSDGLIFDTVDKSFRLLIIAMSDSVLVYKEIFPNRDSLFYPIAEMGKQTRYGEFRTEFKKKVELFNSLEVDRVFSDFEKNLIVLVRDDFAIAFSPTGSDARKTSTYSNYIKYDDQWYYLLK